MTLSTYPLFPWNAMDEHQSLPAADRVFSAERAEGTYVAFRLLLNDQSLNRGSGWTIPRCHVRREDRGNDIPSACFLRGRIRPSLTIPRHSGLFLISAVNSRLQRYTGPGDIVLTPGLRLGCPSSASTGSGPWPLSATTFRGETPNTHAEEPHCGSERETETSRMKRSRKRTLADGQKCHWE